MRRSDRPVLRNMNGRRLVARQLPLRSTVVVVERVGFLVVLAGSVSSCLSLRQDYDVGDLQALSTRYVSPDRARAHSQPTGHF